MIQSNEISFVIQGPIVPDGPFSTINVCGSIRKYFPDSEIVLSTWENEIVTKIYMIG